MQIPSLTPQAPPTPDSMGQISPQSAAPMVAFQYPPASYEASSRPAVSPIVSYHQSISAWGSPPEAIAHFETEFSSPMVSGLHPLTVHGYRCLPPQTSEPQHTVYTSVTSQPSAFTF